MPTTVTLPIDEGRDLTIEIGRMAKQANGAVLVRMGDTLVLVTAVMSANLREGLDFFPLTCDYEERMYAAGKIPGGFPRREGRPTEKAILTGRLIDRPIRPLFPSGMRNDVQVIGMPLCVDMENQPDIMAMIGASAALAISDIPWSGPIGAVRVGLIDGQFVAHPTSSQMDESRLDLVIAGTRDAMTTMEAGASEVSEDEMLAAIDFGLKEIARICDFIDELVKQIGQTKTEVTLFKVAPDVLEAVRSRESGLIAETIQNPDKAARENALGELTKEIVGRLSPDFPEREKELPPAVDKVIKEEVRKLVLDRGLRPDGRKLDQIRPLSAEVGLLPRVHGSGLFTRGQTQALTTVTLGSLDEEQMLDSISRETSKRYMHHYNFPPFSVGEARPLRGAGRREIGHGALAEKALRGMIPDTEQFPYTLRLVSDILESNGSTSMASVCGSTLALLDAGVPIKAPVAGIAMGLMSDGDHFRVLTDIQGMEDFGGDMDFKVAGTREGITAIQMDTKLQGVPTAVWKGALEQARQARMTILDVIHEAMPETRKQLSLYAPRIFKIQINPERIGEVIGPGGKVIKRICAETGAKIDIEQDGKVYIAAVDGEAGERARQWIESLVKEAQIGEEYDGKVTRLMGIGAFVELFPGKEGLVPTSRLSKQRIRSPEEVVKVGDTIKVRVAEIDSQGRVNLVRTDVDAAEDEHGNGGPQGGGPYGSGRPDRGRRPDRGYGGDRGGYDRGSQGDRRPAGRTAGPGGRGERTDRPTGDRPASDRGPSDRPERGDRGTGDRTERDRDRAPRERSRPPDFTSEQPVGVSFRPKSRPGGGDQ